MYTKVDLTREGNIKFLNDCLREGISEYLAKATLGVLEYNKIALFKYDLSDSISNYYLIGEDTSLESDISNSEVKLCCNSNELYKIVDYAISEVVLEIESELKGNYTLGSGEPTTLKYCGDYLGKMYKEYIITFKDIAEETDYTYNGRYGFSKSVYYYNLIKIFLSEFAK